MKNVLQVAVPNVAEYAHVYRQIFATIAVSMLSLVGGITFGFTAVLLPQLQTDSSFPYDESYDSWIASISPLSMLIGSVFSGWMSDAIGRKAGQLILIVPYILGWIIMGVATNNTAMLIGRFVTGVCRGAMRSHSMVYVGELSDPKYRAVALFCPAAGLHTGVLISHIVGTYCHWTTSCFIFTLPTIIAFAILIFLKESPLWLLSKGKIDEGIESYRQFRGNGDSAEKELSTILEKLKEKAEEITAFKDTLNIVFSKPFMKSMVTIFLLCVASQWCGVQTISFYAQVIFEKTFSGDVDAFMLMIVTDCIRIAAVVCVCIFAKFLPRKITFVVTCVATALVLIGLVIYLYLAPVGVVWIAITCLVIYIAMASAMTSVSWSFVSEIFPLTVRGLGSSLSTTISFVLLFLSVKVTPEIMYRYGEIVMYATFAGVTLFTGFILSFVLPETNGRTLQDIEDSLYKKKGEVKKDIEMVTSPYSSAVYYVEKL